MTWSQLTIGKRIVAGFGVVLILLALAGVLSYLGVGGIVDNASQVIEGNRLDGVLAQKEVDHLNWAGAVNTFLNDDRVTEIKVQLDPTKCGFGQWLYGQGRQAAEAQIPSLSPLLKEIEAAHTSLHNSAKEIKAVYASSHPGLMAQLNQFLADHMLWSGQVGDRLAEEAGGLYYYQQLLKNAVDLAHSTMGAVALDETKGSMADRKTAAMEVLRSMRFGKEGKNYVYVNSLDGISRLHPIKPSLEGTDVSTLKDKRGKAFVEQMMDLAASEGHGFVTYYWASQDGGAEVPKLTYLKNFKPWGWYVAAGLDMDPNNQSLIARAEDFANKRPYRLGVETDPEACPLGKWMASAEAQALRKAFPALDEALSAIKETHDKLHATALDIQVLITRGEVTQAIAKYNQETKPALDVVKAGLEMAIAAEDELGQKAAQARAIYAQKTQPSLVKVQALLNQIRDEANKHTMTDEVMLKAAQGTRFQVSLVSLVAILVGLLLSWFIIRGITHALKDVSDQMGEGAEQVASASGQVSSASQSLAEGSSQQAASLEETSSSLEEMASMTKQNADNAGQADSLVKETTTVVDRANRSMKDLKAAMGKITAASDETAKIIRTIDEIAFQTNLLALNAAVEAARAGEAGAGFAVVADEVRNLAMRAAEAARSTSDLIEGNIANIKEGAQLVDQADEAFDQVAESNSKVSELVGEIAAASQEQSQGIDQVNRAASEMDRVTQQVAANAEESAASSEELSAQAEQLRGLVQRLQALVVGDKTDKPKKAKKVRGKKKKAKARELLPAGRAEAPAPAAPKPAAKPAAKTQAAKAAPAPAGTDPAQVIPFDEDEDGDFQDF